MTDELTQARRAINWAALSPTEQQHIVRQHAWHCIIRGQSKRWCKAHRPASRLKFRPGSRFGDLRA